ncbi:MAG: sigma-70 family RNA polymerase sigma factor [Candidatus Omnitrophica bacterium]|nr:sigma-70 family RNA polymerase sigma factor [Candidatus Omnitrophota bacterium]
MPPIPTDEQLARQAQAGERTAFEELAARYYPRLLNLALRMCGNREYAEETLQEAFLRAWEKLHTFRGESGFKAWLYKIATNFCYMKFRKIKSAPPMESLSLWLRSDAGEEGGADREIPDWSTDPQRALQNKDLRAAMDTALAELQEQQRLIFLLREVEGFSAQEVAGMTGLSVPAVKSRLHRARLFLRERLVPYFESAAGGSYA